MRLRMLGGLSLDGESPPPLGPRQLSLLALVAAAGSQGVTRERAIGILWPDAPEEQARHTLSQTLYNMRRAAGCELIVGTTQLRLAPSLDSDLGELRAALQSGALASAATHYSGRLLDGFYLPGAPEFERWVEEQRAALERDVLRAVESLARESDHSGDRDKSVRWWRRLIELEPLSARATIGGMRAFAAAGDLTGALALARDYRSAVRRELDADPDPSIATLEAELRAAAPPQTIDPPVSVQPHPAPLPSPTPFPEPVGPALVSAVKGARGFVLIGLGAVIAIALAFRPTGAGPALPVLAVSEIQTGETGDSTRVGLVLRDMLATSLGGVEGLEVVANSRLVELMPRGADTVAGAVANAARRAGASEILEGELATEPAGLVLTLRRVSLPRGVVRKGYVVRARDRYTLVDSATALIARDLQLAPPLVTVAEIRTSSPAAYALYDEGLRAMYGYDAPAARRLMTAALSRDSNFAMAAYYAWLLTPRGMDSATPAHARRVERLARRTIERERLLILASTTEQLGSLADYMAIAETLSVKYPNDPEGQIALGKARHSAGDWAGSVAALQRAFALDSSAGALGGPYCRVCVTLAETMHTYLWWDSLAAVERVGRRLIALRPGEQVPHELLESLLRQGRRAEAEELFATAGSPPGWDAFLNRDLVRWSRFEEADRQLIALALSLDPADRADGVWLLLLSLRDQGRLEEAAALNSAGRLPGASQQVPGPRPALGFLPLEMGRPLETARAYHSSAAAVARGPGPPAGVARHRAWELALAGTGYAAAGDTATARRLADSLERIGQASTFGRDLRLHHMLRGLLLQGEARHAEAAAAFRQSLYSLSDGYTRTNLMLARSLLALGRGAEAIPVLQPAIRGGVDGSNTYVSRTELHEALAQAFEQAGQRDSARVHYAAVERAWRRADPPFRERYVRAKSKAGL